MSAMDLTPGEALLLLEPNKRQGREAINVSLTWLLAKKFLTTSLEDKPGYLGRFFAKTSRLRPTDRLPPDLPGEMDDLMQLVRRTGYIDDLVKAARARYGNDFNGFQTRHLIPSLLRRGLIEVRTNQFLMVFSRTRYQRTPSGDALRNHIDALVARAREIPNHLDKSPTQAAAIVATLGGLIFLVPELKPHFAEIADTMRRSRGAETPVYPVDTYSATTPGQNEPSAEGTLTLDFPSLDLGTFDAFNGGMVPLDASFDAAATSGGGADGGGADGGGSGGGE